MKKWFVVSVLLAVLALPGLSKAKEKQKDMATLEEVVVTATKTEEKRKDVPNSIIIMDEIDIQESPARSLGELLANELGIDLRAYGNYGGASQEIHIRGMSGDATQVFVNGVNVNSPSLGVADVAKIPLNSIERIEVVKGSGSLLYGSGAMGGTINIITKRPKRKKTDLKISAGYGSEDTYHLSAEQGMYLSDNFGYYLTANRKETDGFRDNSDLTHNDISLKLVLDKGDIFDISLYGDYTDREYGRPGVKTPAGTQDDFIGGTKFYNSESASLLDRGGDKDGHAVLRVKSHPTEWLVLNFKQDYTDIENYNYRRDPAAWPPKLAGEGAKTWVTNRVATSEGNVDIKPFDGADLLLGGEYKGFDFERRNIDLDNTGEEKPGTESVANYHVFTKGAFIEAQYRPSRYFKALAGVRHEKHSTFGHETLPRYGLIINPSEKTVLKLSHGKHFKAPTMNDLYWPDDGWARGNPELKPERGWHTDATLEQSLYDDKLFLSLSYFRWDIEDRIAWAENPNYPTIFPGWNKWTPSNVDAFNGRGWEVGLKIGPLRNMILSLDYTYTEAKEQKKGGPKRQALYTPDGQFKGSLTYWAPFGLTVSTMVRYMSDRPANYVNDTDELPQNTIDSYWTADLKLEYPLQDNWVLSLHASNIFDEEYDTYMENFKDQSTGVITREGYPGAGRSVFFSVGYEY